MVRRGESVKQYVNRMIEEMVQAPQSGATSNYTKEFVELRISTLPFALRRRGRILMDHLKRNNFVFSKQGEFIPFGHAEPIAGSRIDELVLFTLRRPHHWRIGPVGFSDFLMHLESSDVPRGLISNRHYPNYVWNKKEQTYDKTINRTSMEKMNQSDFKRHP